MTDEIAVQVGQIWSLIDPDGSKRAEFAAAAKKEQEEERIRAAERQAEEAARYVYGRVNRKALAWKPDYASEEYRRILAVQRLRDGLPSRPDLAEYEKAPPMKHRLRMLDNVNLLASANDAAAIRAAGDELEAIRKRQDDLMAQVITKLTAKTKESR